MNKLTLTSIIVMLIVPFVLIAVFWADIPDIIPIHFNASGEADRFDSKMPYIFLMPGINLFTFALLYLIPYIDPKKRISPDQKGYVSFMLIMVVFFFVLFLLMFSQIMGMNLFGNYILVVIPLFIMMLGNYMSKVRPNYFVGIRTPWTLQNETVWERTHRFTGRLWVGTSIVMLILGLALNSGYPKWLTIVYVSLIAILPFVFSYLEYKKVQPDTEVE